MFTIRQIGINVVTQWATFLVRAIIGIVLVPFLISELGRNLYGLAVILGVIVSIADIADLGLREALGRHLAEALTVKDEEKYNKLASTAGFIWLVSGTLIAGLCVWYASEISNFLGVSPDVSGDAVNLIIWFCGSSIVIAFIQPVFTAVIASSNRFDLISKINAFQTIIMGAGLFLVISFSDLGIYGWAIIVFLTNSISILIKVYFSFSIVKKFRLSPRLVNLESFKSLFAISGYMFFHKLTSMLSMKADPLIISRYLGAHGLAIYNPGLMLGSKVQPLVAALGQQLYPVTTKYYTTGDTKKLHQALFTGTRVTWALAIGVFCTIGILSQEISRIWLESTLGQDYKTVGTVLFLWSLFYLILNTAGTQFSILIAHKKVAFLACTQFPFSIVNILASVLLIIHTNLGVISVIIPTLAIEVLRRLVTFFYVSSVAGLNPFEYFKEAYGRCFILLGALLIISLAVKEFLQPGGFFNLFLAFSIIGVSWIALIWFFVLQNSEKKLIISHLLVFKIRTRR